MSAISYDPEVGDLIYHITSTERGRVTRVDLEFASLEIAWCDVRNNPTHKFSYWLPDLRQDIQNGWFVLYERDFL